VRKKPAVFDPEHGVCEECGAETAWPGNGVACDEFDENKGGPCGGLIVPK